MNSQKTWKILSESKKKNDTLSNESIIQILLANRGLQTKKEIDAFLHPKLEEVTLTSVKIDKKEISAGKSFFIRRRTELNFRIRLINTIRPIRILIIF